jgi:integrase
MRHGEVAGLRWRNLDLEAQPLGRLLVATSYARGSTKTGVERRVPIHPTLRAMAAEYRLEGWPKLMKRPAGPDDLVVPSYRGRMRHKGNTLRFLHLDLELLGARARRVHDLRATFISLSREDGADLYVRVPWEVRCAELAKLRIERRRPQDVGRLVAQVGVAGRVEDPKVRKLGAGRPAKAR